MAVSPLIVVALLAALPQFDVQTTDGNVVSGTLTQLSSQSISIQLNDGDEKQFSVKQIIDLKPANPTGKIKKQDYAIYLANDQPFYSAVPGLTNRTIEATTSFGTSIELRKSSVQAVQFPLSDNAGNEELQNQWNELLESNTSGDMIVLSRDGQLISQEVIIHGISPQGVNIQLDDIQTTVDLSKLFGLIFFQRDSREYPSPICKIITSDTSEFSVKELAVKESQLVASLVTGESVSIPFEAIQKLDFAAGNILFLDQLQPYRITWTPAIESTFSNELLSFVYTPKFFQVPATKPIRLAFSEELKSYNRGIRVHGGSELLYEIPKGFRLLQLVAGPAPENAGTCTAVFSVVGDQKRLHEQSFSIGSKPVELTIDVTGVRRLKLIIDAADGEDFGDVLHLCQPKLIK